MSHPIAAVSTGNQVSAIGILRLSGEGCIAIAGQVFQPNSGTPLTQAPSRKLLLAVSTGNQVSAIGILRLSGEGCITIAGQVFQPNSGTPLTQAPSRKLLLGRLLDKQCRLIDSCCAIVCRAPHSYTGEDTVEFHCHGSPAVLAAGLESLYHGSPGRAASPLPARFSSLTPAHP